MNLKDFADFYESNKKVLDALGWATGLIGGFYSFFRWGFPRVKSLCRFTINFFKNEKGLNNKLNMVVADFENDDRFSSERSKIHEIISDSIDKWTGVKVIFSHKSISTTDINHGHSIAEKWLQNYNCDLVIWGKVTKLSDGNESIRLIFTARPNEGEDGIQQDKKINITDIPKENFLDIFQIIMIARAGWILNQSGSYVADSALQTADKIESLLTRSKTINPTLDKGLLWRRLGNMLFVFGIQKGDRTVLNRSILAFQNAMTENPLEKTPLEWAAAKSNLGASLRVLGESESGTQKLEEAVSNYRAALEVYSREKNPVQWAATKNNLGIALMAVGKREVGTEKLKEAEVVFRESLLERTREKMPLEWAATKNNLASVLTLIGKIEPEKLEDAVLSYKDALKERTRSKVPLDWSSTQNNLGAALRVWGTIKKDEKKLSQAINAFFEALKEITRKKNPLSWAKTQNNLGNAFSELGKLKNSKSKMIKAKTAYEKALQEYARDKYPLDWATTQNNLGATLLALGEMDNKLEYLEKAKDVFRNALEELNGSPEYKKLVEENLKNVLNIIKKHNGN